MKRKKLLTLAGAVFGIVLVVSLITGTIAYFMKEFSSDENIATAATFDIDVVNSAGETIGDGEFDLGDDLYPGMERKEVYTFDVQRNNTVLPVEYQVDLLLTGDLFPEDGSSPVVLTMEREIDGEWIEVDHSTTFKPESDVESYRIFVEWPHSDNDIDFQGLTGNVALEVIAKQVEEEPLYTGEIRWRSSSFEWSHHDTSNQEIEFYYDENELRVIKVYISDDENFKEKVGDFSITEMEPGVYHVVSENDAYTLRPNMWRVNEDTIDTSVEGYVKFNKRDNVGDLDRHILIESQELYEWFTE